jgi:hypothetical protein
MTPRLLGSVMKSKRDKIAYVFEPIPNGRRVRIAMTDAEALHAVHQFLGFKSTITGPGTHIPLLPQGKRRGSKLGVIEEGHEAVIHMELLVAVEQRETRVVGGEVDLCFLVPSDHHDIF